MSNSTRITRTLCEVLADTALAKFVRAPLAAIALFCIAAATAPQAVAQACGSSITLNANQWRMVGIPCVPAVANRTVGGVFGPSMGTSEYGVTWIVWKRVYNDSQCVVSSGPRDCYVKLTATSPASVGDGFWIFTTLQKTIQFPSSSTATPGTDFRFPAQLSPDGKSRFYLFANPFSTQVSWANFLFATTIRFLGIFDIDVQFSTQQAVNASIVSKNVNYWNGNTYFTRDLSSPVATFTPKEAAWLEMLTPAAYVVSGVTVIVPKP